MLNTQLISKGLFLYYNSATRIATRIAAESIPEVFTNTQLLPIIAIITVIASILFGAYKLAMHLGYFSPNENESNAPSVPPKDTFFRYEPVTPSAPPDESNAPSAPPHEGEPSESSPEMQARLFARFYPRFGNSS